MPRPNVGTRFSKACAFWDACDACSAVIAGSGTPVKKLGENFPKLPNGPGELFVASAFGTGENGGKVLRIGGLPWIAAGWASPRSRGGGSTPLAFGGVGNKGKIAAELLENDGTGLLPVKRFAALLLDDKFAAEPLGEKFAAELQFGKIAAELHRTKFAAELLDDKNAAELQLGKIAALLLEEKFAAEPLHELCAGKIAVELHCDKLSLDVEIS